MSVPDVQPDYRLEMKRISKGFPGVQALSDVSLSVRPGEVHALLGENGAGKSTLVKILSGAYGRDNGEIFLDGQPITIKNPNHALQLGIVTIYQDSNLALRLTVAENIYMGRMPVRGRQWVDWDKLFADANGLLGQLDTTFDGREKVANLSPAQRQMVEIAKALSIDARLIVLDEPTSALTEREVESLFAVMARLRDRGVSLILITHRLPEVFRICDRLTVLRDGHWIATNATAETTEHALVTQMVGREVTHLYPVRSAQAQEPVLEVHGLRGEGFDGVTFTVCAGEIVGLFGLVGSGRTELARAIFGAEPPRSGSVSVDGKPVTPRSPRNAIRGGIALVPEDRKTQGLVLGMAVRSNISLPNLSTLTRLGFLRFKREAALANSYKALLGIRTPTIETRAQSLSGGNQQKVVMSKWLAKKPRVLLLDEPTRGIDIGAKAEVHKLVDELTAQGVGVLLISSELPEVMGMSDRILIMHEGRLLGEMSREEATEENIMSLIALHSTEPA